MTLNIKSRRYLFNIQLLGMPMVRGGIVDPDFDNDNHFPPTAETLDHYQPHHRVLSDELTR
jgi:hypothetical protein